MRLFALYAIALAALAQCCASELVFVYSIRRHGARNVLPKTATLQEGDNDGGPSLLPQGETQCYEAGMAFRQRYIDSNSCAAPVGASTCILPSGTGVAYGVFGAAGVGFQNHNLLVNSSALIRTLMSADSFLAGVFPSTSSNASTATNSLPYGQQVVPIVSVAESEDYLIRGYTRCPTYANRLLDWYNSPEFVALEDSTEPLRSKVAQLAPSLNTSLANWWNVYDAFNVWLTYQVGDEVPDPGAETFAQIKALANLVETDKMRSNLTGNLIGGAMLGEMLYYMDQAVSGASSDVTSGFGAVKNGGAYARLIHISAHYNTQLALLGALQIDQQADLVANITWLHTIPALAAVLSFEVHQITTSGYAVRAVYQDGPAANYTTLPLPCASAGDDAEQALGAGACTMAAFVSFAGPRAINGSDAWCAACDNTATNACQAADLKQQLAASASAAVAATGCPTTYHGGFIAFVVLFCVVAVAAIALAIALVATRRSTGKRNALSGDMI